MKSIDVRKKYRVTLTFLLDEEVTPSLFAVKIARACARGALRPGEAVIVPDTDMACFVTDEPPALPYFGHKRHVSQNKGKRSKARRSRNRSR